MITPFREMIPHVYHLTDLFLKDRFDVTLTLTLEEKIVYKCSFVNSRQAELYFEHACRSYDLEDFEYWMSRLVEEMLYVWNMEMITMKK